VHADWYVQIRALTNQSCLDQAVAPALVSEIAAFASGRPAPPGQPELAASIAPLAPGFHGSVVELRWSCQDVVAVRQS
jgi:hypothetical protein